MRFGRAGRAFALIGGFLVLGAAMMSISTLPAGFRIISVLGLGSITGLALGDVAVDPDQRTRATQARRRKVTTRPIVRGRALAQPTFAPPRPASRPARLDRRAQRRAAKAAKRAAEATSTPKAVPRIVFQTARPGPRVVTARPSTQKASAGRPVVRPQARPPVRTLIRPAPKRAPPRPQRGPVPLARVASPQRPLRR